MLVRSGVELGVVVAGLITCILYMNYMIINANKSINYSIYMHVIIF